MATGEECDLLSLTQSQSQVVDVEFGICGRTEFAHIPAPTSQRRAGSVWVQAERAENATLCEMIISAERH